MTRDRLDLDLICQFEDRMAAENGGTRPAWLDRYDLWALQEMATGPQLNRDSRRDDEEYRAEQELGGRREDAR